MNFYIVFCKSRRKFDKYIKVNRIKNKVIIDIRYQLEEHQIKDLIEHRDFFNLLIFTKITQSLKKNKDIYYIPNFYDENLNISEITNIKNYINDVNFNTLIFYDDFENGNNLLSNIIDKLDIFDTSQIIRDY
jgi:hypothetical protein